MPEATTKESRVTLAFDPGPGARNRHAGHGSRSLGLVSRRGLQELGHGELSGIRAGSIAVDPA